MKHILSLTNIGAIRKDVLKAKDMFDIDKIVGRLGHLRATNRLSKRMDAELEKEIEEYPGHKVGKITFAGNAKGRQKSYQMEFVKIGEGYKDDPPGWYMKEGYIIGDPNIDGNASRTNLVFGYTPEEFKEYKKELLDNLKNMKTFLARKSKVDDIDEIR